MIDSEFERKGREMSDELNQIQPIPEVDLEYTWPSEPLPVPVCLQVASCNGAAILALEKRIAELERERDAIGAVLAEKSRNAVVSGGTPTLTERAANNRIAELERERDAANKRAKQAEAELDLYNRNLSLDAIRAIAEINSGKELHRSWRDTMLSQGRHVLAERMVWDLLPTQDKELDIQIAYDVLSDFAAYLYAQADLDFGGGAKGELAQLRAELEEETQLANEGRAQAKTDAQVAACSCVEPVLVGANPLESVCMWCGKRVRK